LYVNRVGRSIKAIEPKFSVLWKFHKEELLWKSRTSTFNAFSAQASVKEYASLIYVHRSTVAVLNHAVLQSWSISGSNL